MTAIRFMACALAIVGLSVGTTRPESEAPTAATRVRGVVVDVSGAPIAEATVLGKSADPGTKVMLTSTDSSGRFELSFVGATPLALRVEHPGHAPTERQVEALTGDLRFVLDAGGTITGSVVARDERRPIAGAEIVASKVDRSRFDDADQPDRNLLRTTSDAEGRFTFQRVTDGAWSITAASERHARESTEVRVTSAARDASPVTLFLAPGTSLFGVVVDDKNEPIAEAEVDFRPKLSSFSSSSLARLRNNWTTKSETNGSFMLLGLPKAEEYRLRLRHPKYAPTSVVQSDNARGSREAPIRLRMNEGGDLVARLLAGEEQPFTGVISLRYVPEEATPNAFESADLRGTYVPENPRIRPRVSNPVITVEAGGRLKIERLPLGRGLLELDAKGFRPLEVGTVAIAAGEARDLGSFTLVVGDVLSGRVVDRQGRPITGAEVSVTTESAKTDADGRFKLTGLESDKPLFASVDAEGFGRKIVREIDLSQPLTVELVAEGNIRGRVLASGRAPRRFQVRAVPVDLPSDPLSRMMQGRSIPEATYTEEAAGEFTLEVPEGRYTIDVRADGHLPARLVDKEVIAGKELKLGEVALEVGAAIRGRVTDRATGKPLAGASVSIVPPGGLLAGLSGSESTASPVETDLEGRFTIDGLAPGNHKVAARREPYAVTSAEVRIDKGVPFAELQIALGSGGAIEGVVRNSEGRPVSGSNVMLMSMTQPEVGWRTATADAVGSYRFDNLPAGGYQILYVPVSSGKEKSAIPIPQGMLSVTVEEGKTTVARDPSSARIRWSGVARRGKQPIRANLTWVREGEASGFEVVSCDSDENGLFEVGLPAPGDYQVSVSDSADAEKLAFGAATVKVRVPDEPVIERDLVISDVDLRGVVTDADSGEPLGQVMVGAMRLDDGIVDENSATFSQTGADGGFKLSALEEGDYQLVATQSGHAIHDQRLHVDGSDSLDELTIALGRGIPFKVVISDADGAPLAGAAVFPLNLGVMPGMIPPTDGFGEVTIGLLGAGDHRLVGLAKGLAPHRFEAAVQPPETPGQTLVVSVVLSRGAPLDIRVLDEGDQPLALADIVIKDEDGTNLSPAFAGTLEERLAGNRLRTDAAGQARIPAMEPGEYYLEARKDGKRGTRKVTVDGKAASVEIKLK